MEMSDVQSSTEAADNTKQYESLGGDATTNTPAVHGM